MDSSVRSKSCLNVASKSGSTQRKQSPSPAKQRVKRRKRSADTENCKAESLTGKVAPLKTKCNRSLSKSPRRNSWRDEILDMKSWKEEKDAASVRKSRSIAVKSKVVQGKRSVHVAVSKLKALQMSDEIPKVQSSSKEPLVQSLSKEDSNKKISVDCKALRDTKSGCFSNEKVSKAVDFSQVLNSGSIVPMRIKAQGSVRDPRRKAIDQGRRIGAKQAVTSIPNCVGEVKGAGCKGALKDVEHTYVNSCVSANGHPHSVCGLKQLTLGSIASSKPGERTLDTCNGHHTVEMNSGAMADSVSRLELQMEVYNTRLKELEWQRDQLRKERLAFNCT